MVIHGVIRPPPEIRAVADRTALYVAKNGRGFEVRILNSEKGKTPKFAFLHTTNPFHAYYEERISFYEKGGKDDDAKGSSSETKGKSEDQSKKDDNKKPGEPSSSEKKKAKVVTSVGDPVARALLAQRNKIAEIRSSLRDDGDAKNSEESKEETNQAGINLIPPPPTQHFINIVPPSSLSVPQIETIQLVAQMTALDGKGGGFLQSLTLREWNNPEFAFCQPRHGYFAYFSALVDAYSRVLSLWTDKKTVTDDNTAELADNVQACLEAAAYRAEYERDQAENRRKGEDGVSASALVDWHDFVVVETIDFPLDEKVLTLPPPPPPPPPPAAAVTAAEDAAKGKRGDDDMDDSDDDEQQIRVVPSYKPKIVSAVSASTDMVIDPITGKSVAAKDMPEHMRIQLLDPKWAEERKKFQDKQKESNLVGGDVIADNLTRFAQARGVGGEDALSREKRLKDANRVLREQSLHSSTPVGPSLPGAAPSGPPVPKPAGPPPGFDASVQPPDAKKPRLDVPPPPPPPTAAAAAAAEVPTTVAQAPTMAAAVAEVSTGAEMDSFAAHNAAELPSGAPSGSEPLSEAAFAASLSRPDVTLQIRVPNDPAQMAWNFYGQIVSLSIDVKTKVKAVKQELSRLHLNNMPANKIQLKSAEKGVFLKDSLSLAALNIGPTAALDLIPKTRGGRK